MSTCGQDSDLCKSHGGRPHPQPLSANTQKREAKPLHLSGPSLSCWGKGLQALSGAWALSLDTPRRKHGWGRGHASPGMSPPEGASAPQPPSLIYFCPNSEPRGGGCALSAPPVTWWRLCPPSPQPCHLTSLSLPPTHLAQPQAHHMPSTVSAAPVPQPEGDVSAHQQRPW